MSTPYSKVLDNLAETVSMLALWHGVSREGILLVGNFNAHARALDCGHPALDNIMALGPAMPIGWYQVERFLSCRATRLCPTGRLFPMLAVIMAGFS